MIEIELSELDEALEPVLNLPIVLDVHNEVSLASPHGDRNITYGF